MTKRYRKKPVEIEAVQLTPENVAEVAAWCGGTVNTVDDHTVVLRIDTLEGPLIVDPKDRPFIIRGVQGEHYPCKLDIFEATYDSVEEAMG